jgi:hypothetical protein
VGLSLSGGSKGSGEGSEGSGCERESGVAPGDLSQAVAAPWGGSGIDVEGLAGAELSVLLGLCQSHPRGVWDVGRIV